MQATLRLQQQAADLQKENNTARYTALQNQLNPHFLFNSLNTLIAEIEYDPANAVHFTKNLSNVYRYVLQCQEKPLITLGAVSYTHLDVYKRQSESCSGTGQVKPFVHRDYRPLRRYYRPEKYPGRPVDPTRANTCRYRRRHRHLA